MINDENSKETRESIQKRSHWAQLNHFWGKWMVDDWLNRQWPMLYATDINTGFLKLWVSVWGLSTDDVINLNQRVGQKLTTGWHNHHLHIFDKNGDLTPWPTWACTNFKDLFFREVIFHQFLKRKNIAPYSKIVLVTFPLYNLAQKSAIFGGCEKKVSESD